MRAELRPYQRSGLNWLHFLAQFGLGACLADDMGLGKTVQVIALLLALKQDHEAPRPATALVAGVRLADRQLEGGARALCAVVDFIVTSVGGNGRPEDCRGGDRENVDLVITTYGMFNPTGWLRKRTWLWRSSTKRKRSRIPAARPAPPRSCRPTRIAMTGTPVENRLSDLWSLFDFLNPGLLGGAKTFASFVKRMEANTLPTSRCARWWGHTF